MSLAQNPSRSQKERIPVDATAIAHLQDLILKLSALRVKEHRYAFERFSATASLRISWCRAARSTFVRAVMTTSCQCSRCSNGLAGGGHRDRDLPRGT